MKLVIIETLSEEEKKDIIKKSFKSVYDLWVFGVISKEEYKSIKAKYKAKIEGGGNLT